MLGELLKKVVNFFVERTKPANNFYVENLNHLPYEISLYQTMCRKQFQKKKKRKQLFQVLIVH